LEAELLAMLDQGGSGTSICPSELARRLRLDDSAWCEVLERIRMAARRLHRRGELEIVQSANSVDPDRARGPIRVRRRGGR
jgi:hypothetical protein